MEKMRGQAAMEYLMTYGWAILVIVIVLAALLYLGIFNVKPPEVCTMPSGMTCTKNYLFAGTKPTAAGANPAAGEARLEATLVNGLQKTIVVTNASCTKDPTKYEDCAAAGTAARCGASAAGGATVPMGATLKINVTCLDDNGVQMGFSSGDEYNGKINLAYYFKDEGAGAIRRISGNFYTRVT